MHESDLGHVATSFVDSHVSEVLFVELLEVLHVSCYLVASVMETLLVLLQLQLGQPSCYVSLNKTELVLIHTTRQLIHHCS